MSATKKAPARRPIPAERQSAPARRAAEAVLKGLVDKHAPAHRRLIAATRAALRKRLPTAHEVVYEYRDWIVTSFTPTGQGYEGVLAVRADADGVQLYFNRGKSLPDPDKLLKGSASQVRYHAMDGAATLARPAVARLIDEALAHNPIPFEPAGRGSVTVRPTAATPRKKA